LRFKGQVHYLKLIIVGLDLHFQRHQGVVEEPVFGVKGQVILSLDESDVGANVELVLEMTHKVK